MDAANHKRGVKKRDGKKVKIGIRVKLWTRFSPAYIFRAFRDSYVKGCVTASNSAQISQAAHAAAFQVCDVETLSRAASRHCSDDDAAVSQTFRNLPSCESGRQASRRSSVHQSPAPITGPQQSGLTVADLQSYNGGGPVTVRGRPSFETVPESGLYTDTQVSRTALEALFRSSSLHPTDFLQPSPSRRVTALAGPLPGPTLARGGSARTLRRRPSSRLLAPSPILHGRAGRGSPLTPLAPLVDMTTFLERKKSQKSTERPNPWCDYRRPDGADGVHPSSPGRRDGRLARWLSSRSPSRPASAIDDLLNLNPKKATRPNPYQDYDTRAPSPTPTV